jgi:hypothetical protein
MLLPRLTSCTECANISSLLREIECKLFELSKKLYNNIIFSMTQSFQYDVMIDLLNYKRILTYKTVNPDYAEDYTIDMIASKIKLLKYK